MRERKTYETFRPPKRVLLGPGPCPVEDCVLEAMAAPVLGHLDPLFLRCMDDIQEMLRYVFETDNRVTVPISATGSAGMEASLVNVIEPGDEIIVCIHGVFGERMLDIIERAGGNQSLCARNGDMQSIAKTSRPPSSLASRARWQSFTPKPRPECSRISLVSPTWFMPKARY